MLRSPAEVVMSRLIACILGVLTVAPAWAEYNYHRPTELLVTLGTQALMICNGRFVSNRPLELIYEQELKLDRMPVLPPKEVAIDEARRTVAVGGGGSRSSGSESTSSKSWSGASTMQPSPSR